MTKYVDVTRLLEWPSRYTGMERFPYEVTKTLVKDDDVRLCGYVAGRGFVDLGPHYAMKDGRLVSPFIGPRESLKHLLKTNKRAFVREYVARRRLARAQAELQPISRTSDDVLLIYDGLWDRQNYIDEVTNVAKSGVKLAHVVHDVVPIVMPQTCFDYVTEAFDGYFKQVAPHIDVLYSISKNTEKDFNQTYDAVLKPGLKRVIIRHGENFEAGEAIRPSSLPQLESGRFLLVVGTMEIRKNHQLLYQAYRLAHERNIDLPPLVIVGREGWMAEVVAQMMRKDPAVKGKFLFAGPVGDAELSWLYQNTLFTVFPALYEGWGLPVAESLYYKKVCAASNSSSIPEIAGPLNHYYSPYSPEECLKVMSEMTDPTVRESLEKRIAEEYRPTTWPETANEIARNL